MNGLWASTHRFKTDRPVYIYTGDGTDKKCSDATYETFVKLLESSARVYKIDDPKTLTNKCLESGSTIVIPGGHTPTISDRLTKDGLGRMIRTVQREEISYIGICAGTYLVADPEYSADCPLARSKFLGAQSTKSSLDFRHKLNWQRVEDIFNEKDGAHIPAIWWYGCAFDRDRIAPNEKPIAFYGESSSQSDNVAVLKPRKNVLLDCVYHEFTIAGGKSAYFAEYPEKGLAQIEREKLEEGQQVTTKWFANQLLQMGILSRSERNDFEEFMKPEAKEPEEAPPVRPARPPSPPVVPKEPKVEASAAPSERPAPKPEAPVASSLSLEAPVPAPRPMVAVPLLASDRKMRAIAVNTLLRGTFT